MKTLNKQPIDPTTRRFRTMRFESLNQIAAVYYGYKSDEVSFVDVEDWRVVTDDVVGEFITAFHLCLDNYSSLDNRDITPDLLCPYCNKEMPELVKSVYLLNA